MLSHPGAQRAAVKSEDLGSTVFATHFPIGLFENPNDILSFHILEGPIGLGKFFIGLFKLIHQVQLGS